MTTERLYIGEMGPVLPNMTWAMPQGSPINTFDTLATFHQQVEESHYDLVNLSTRQMATVLNLLMDSTNQRFNVINHQMNRMAVALDVNDNLDNHNMHNEEDIPS